MRGGTWSYNLPMRLPIRLSAILTGLLSLACFGFAFRGLLALREVTDAQALRDARGFAWFTVFLGAVFLLIAILTWRMAQQEPEA